MSYRLPPVQFSQCIISVVKPQCIIEGCERTSFARQHCHTHYYRLRNGLEMNAPVYDKLSETFEQRFWRNVDKSGSCWLWTGAKSGRYKKYGSFSFKKEKWWAHRAAWTIFNGTIPNGMHVDHRYSCDGLCVTPSHLQLLEPSSHSIDGWKRGEFDSLKSNRQCSLDECDRKHNRLGYCEMHARRMKRTGSPLGRDGKVEALKRGK